MRLAGNIATGVDDLINPIAVKELRQAVKGRFITWTLIIYLLIQLTIIGIPLITFDINQYNYNIGRGVFMSNMLVLLGTCMFIIPTLTAIRFSAERFEQNVDLLFITTLRPVQIIWGKTFAALVLTIMFFCTSMPFITLTYLLRGVDLPSTFALLGLNFLMVAGCVQIGIFLASLPGSIIARAFRLLFGLGVLVLVFSFNINLSYQVLNQSIGSSISSWNFWGPALSIVSLIMLAMGLLFTISVSIITPESANKAIGVRIFLFFTWLITGIMATLWSSGGDEVPIIIWTFSMAFIFGLKLFVSICERQQLSIRIRRKIPKNRFLRIPAFFVFSGAASGISFSILMLTLTYIISAFVIMFYTHIGVTRLFRTEIFGFVSLSLFAICYSLTAMNLKRVFFPHSKKSVISIIIAIVLLFVGSVLPTIIVFLLSANNRGREQSIWLIASPFGIFWDRNILYESLPFSGVWAVLIVGISVPWFIRQVRAFKPVKISQAKTAETNDG